MLRSPALLLCATAIACGADSGATARDGGTAASDARDCTGAACGVCGDSPTRLVGRVTAPNGRDPVPDALVYVAEELRPYAERVECRLCEGAVDGAAAVARTDAAGRFDLGPVPVDRAGGSATLTLVTETGLFRRVARLEVPACAETRVDEALTRLPSSSAGDDHVPRIAVVAGEYDEMACVLVELGIDPGAIDVIDPRAVTDLFGDLGALGAYDLVFVDCGSRAYASPFQFDDRGMRETLAAYVAAGGRLFVTDWAYSFIEQVPELAPYIDFAPDESGAAPEALHAADVGPSGIEVDGHVRDDTLAGWLAAVEAATGDDLVQDDGSVRIGGFSTNWAVQLGAAAGATVWVSGEVPGWGEVPLATSFDHASCGRVLYSSYHTEALDPVGAPLSFPECGRELTPQERVLEYLILHTASCVQID